MSEQHGKTDRSWDPERYRHEAQSPAAKLPEGDLVSSCWIPYPAGFTPLLCPLRDGNPRCPTV